MSNNKSYEIKRIIKYQTRLDNSKTDALIHLGGAVILGTAAAFNLDENFAATVVNFLTQTSNDVIQDNLGRDLMGRWCAILSGANFCRALIEFGKIRELKTISKELEKEENFQEVDRPKQYTK